MRLQDDTSSDISSLFLYSLWVHKYRELDYYCHKDIYPRNIFNCPYNYTQPGKHNIKYFWKHQPLHCLSGQQWEHSSHLR